MKMYALFCCLLLVGFSTAAQANLLNNPGFEEQAGRWECARHWRIDEPDDHGDAWGTAVRANWRAREGSFMGAVQGAWAGIGEYGGFWQEVTIEPGVTYKASAWFWADAAWRADLQEFKLEFWNADRTEKLVETLVPLNDVDEDWVYKEVILQAPAGAVWGRVVVNVNGVGHTGALQVDDVHLNAVP